MKITIWPFHQGVTGLQQLLSSLVTYMWSQEDEFQVLLIAESYMADGFLQ